MKFCVCKCGAVSIAFEHKTEEKLHGINSSLAILLSNLAQLLVLTASFSI